MAQRTDDSVNMSFCIFPNLPLFFIYFSTSKFVLDFSFAPNLTSTLYWIRTEHIVPLKTFLDITRSSPVFLENHRSSAPPESDAIMLLSYFIISGISTSLPKSSKALNWQGKTELKRKVFNDDHQVFFSGNLNGYYIWSWITCWKKTFWLPFSWTHVSFLFKIK